MTLFYDIYYIVYTYTNIYTSAAVLISRVTPILWPGVMTDKVFAARDKTHLLTHDDVCRAMRVRARIYTDDKSAADTPLSASCTSSNDI